MFIYILFISIVSVQVGGDLTQECGIVAVDDKEPVVGIKKAMRGEVPWLAIIYSKLTNPYKPLCVGSLISNNVVITAAQCFWEDNTQQPSSQYAVAVGKLYRPWSSTMDDAQKSNVKTIHLPPRFLGADANFQNDIAVVIVVHPFQFNANIRPVCLSFDYNLHKLQLRHGNNGKIAGWGLLNENGRSSSVLQALVIPYIEFEYCIKESPPFFRQLITSDKICAGAANSSTPICKNDAGSGLAFSASTGGMERYYLKGVVSVAVNTDKLCNTDNYYGLTSVFSHEHFIKQFWNETGKFECLDGSYIDASSICDGFKECPDGSDETERTCSDRQCSTIAFRCHYGACVDGEAACNGVPDCADGSDETKEVCDNNKLGSVVTSTPNPQINKCFPPPPFPDHGTHTIVTSLLSNVSGENDNFELATLTVTCHPGYGVQGSSSIQCFNGYWPAKVPQCIRMCAVPLHPSVEYRCVLSGAQVGSRACAAHEPPGAVLSPRCREPYYYSAAPLAFMRCRDDATWDHVVRCQQDCGRATPKEQPGLAIGGTNAKQGELPWHAGIYDKLSQPYMQVCGGSIISTKLIISAAHCFWQNRSPLPESQFSVAVGKLYRPWDDPVDDAQKSDVKKIHIPPRFRGLDSNFQDDIAVVVVSHAFEYRSFVRPVCLSFDTIFEKQQLQPINKGKVSGWGLISANGKASPTLQVVELPYVDVNTCLDNSPSDFVQYITSDKICAGTRQPNTALCHGDSGGGLVFPATEGYIERYYLRGIVSIAPADEGNNACNTAVYTGFTRIQQHEDFIVPFLTD